MTLKIASAAAPALAINAASPPTRVTLRALLLIPDVCAASLAAGVAPESPDPLLSRPRDSNRLVAAQAKPYPLGFVMAWPVVVSLGT